MAILTFSEWFRMDQAEDGQTARAPQKPRCTEALLMGDILVSWGGEPDFVRRWREEARKDLEP